MSKEVSTSLKRLEKLVTVKHEATPSGIDPEELIPRFVDKHKVPPGRIKRRKELSCKICNLPQAEQDKLWWAYAERGDLSAVLAEAHVAYYTTITAQDIQEHFKKHNIIQPQPPRGTRTATSIEFVESAVEEYKAIITCVYRQRVLKGIQIRNIFWTGKKAKANADLALDELMRKNYLYRYRHQIPGSGKKAVDCYLLNRAGAHYVTSALGMEVNVVVDSIDDVPRNTIEHDTSAADVFVNLRETSHDEIFTLNKKEYQLHLRTQNWYGERHLGMNYYDILRNKQATLQADGFATLSVFNAQDSFCFPFFYEFDRGTRGIEEVSQQITNYIALTVDKVALQRFPELQVKGYHPPVLFVVRKGERVQELAKAVQEKTKSIPQEVRPVALITDETTAKKMPWQRGAWRSLWDPRRDDFTLLEALASASRPLVATKKLNAQSIIKIDMKSAKSGFKRRGPTH